MDTVCPGGRTCRAYLSCTLVRCPCCVVPHWVGQKELKEDRLVLWVRVCLRPSPEPVELLICVSSLSLQSRGEYLMKGHRYDLYFPALNRRQN